MGELLVQGEDSSVMVPEGPSNLFGIPYWKLSVLCGLALLTALLSSLLHMSRVPTGMQMDGADPDETIDRWEHSSRLESHGQENDVPSGFPGVTLLTSAFVPHKGTSYHVNEVFAAVEHNCMNPLINEVHLLTESDCTELMLFFEAVPRRLSSGPFDHVGIIKRKLRCANVPKQPTYADFFDYANTTLSSAIVVLSNGDIVFDHSLILIDAEKLRRARHGYVLSVLPPPAGGEYSKEFHSECRNTPRCVVGAWDGGNWGQQFAGGSWDAYIFAPPLRSSIDLSRLNIIMNLKGAENRAGYQLEVNGGLTLYNPCKHVHAYHWHCFGGKMHDNIHRADMGMDKQQVANVVPCLECPGIRIPEGSFPMDALCERGSWAGVAQIPSLRWHFKNPETVKVCCAHGDCGHINVTAVQLCHRPYDVDCIRWTTVHEHVYY